MQAGKQAGMTGNLRALQLVSRSEATKSRREQAVFVDLDEQQ